MTSMPQKMSQSDEQELVKAGTSSDTSTDTSVILLQEAAEEGKCDQQSTHSVADDNEVDTQTHADDNSPHCVAPVVVSSNSSCCRICQDTDETTEALSTCLCRCKGQLARVHRSCLVEWVRYKGTNRCEICGGIFKGVPNPALGFGVNQIDALENLRQELNHYQPISQRKRTTIAGFLVFLMVISGVSGILTVAADREFQRVNEDPFASEHEAKKSHIVFSICLSFLFFCLTLTMAISILWFILETYFYIHRRRVLNQATSRMVREARRRSALWGTAVL